MIRRSLFIDDEYDMLRFWVVLVIYVAGIFAAATVITTAVITIDWHAQHVSCRQLHEQAGYATRMVGGPFGGECYVQVDERWIPATRYRMVEVGK
jgi:hypothetical protein